MPNNNGKSPVKKYEIVFEPLDDNTPGFLRVQKQALTLAKKMKQTSIEPDVIDEMVDFLLQFVTRPIDRDEAREAVWDCTRKQWTDMLNSVMGNTADVEGASVPTVPTTQPKTCSSIIK